MDLLIFKTLPYLILIGTMLALLFWMWTIYDCATKETAAGDEKNIWLFILIFVPLLGSIVYYLVRIPNREQEQYMKRKAEQQEKEKELQQKKAAAQQEKAGEQQDKPDGRQDNTEG